MVSDRMSSEYEGVSELKKKIRKNKNRPLLVSYLLSFFFRQSNCLSIFSLLFYLMCIRIPVSTLLPLKYTTHAPCCTNSEVARNSCCCRTCSSLKLPVLRCLQIQLRPAKHLTVDVKYSVAICVYIVNNCYGIKYGNGMLSKKTSFHCELNIIKFCEKKSCEIFV